MTSSTPAPAPKKRNPVTLALDVAAGIVLPALGLFIGLAVLSSAIQYGGLQADCGVGPYQGLSCNATVLSIVVFGLIGVSVIAFFLGLGFFIVSLLRRRVGFYWPLAAIVVTVGLFYLGSWVAGLTLP